MDGLVRGYRLSTVAVAAWPDRAWLGRAVRRLACRHLLHLDQHVPVPPRTIDLDGSDGLFFYFEPGALRAELAIAIRLPGGTARRFTRPAAIRSIAVRGEPSGLMQARLRWWIYNEVWWAPECIEQPFEVQEWLQCEDADPDGVPSSEAAWGSSVLNPEPYQLLGVPPPVVWRLVHFECAMVQPR